MQKAHKTMKVKLRGNTKDKAVGISQENISMQLLLS